jgi:tetratricopeptide (TPR) repeat protein
MGPEMLILGAVVAALGVAGASRKRQREILVAWRRGHAELVAGRYAEAEASFRSTLALAERRFGSEHWRTALHVNALAQALLAQKRLDDAAPLVARAMALHERWIPLPHPELAVVLVGAAAYENARGDDGRALELVARARREAKGNVTVRAIVERTLARMEAGSGHPEAAAEALARIPVDRLEPRDVRSLASSGLARMRAGDAARAVRCFLSAHAVAERDSPGEFSEAFFGGLLGEALARCGRDDEASRVLEQSLVDHDAVVGEHHPAAARLLVELAEVRLRLGDAAGAKTACDRVLALPAPGEVRAYDPYRAGATVGDPLDDERARARALLARLGAPPR